MTGGLDVLVDFNTILAWNCEKASIVPSSPPTKYLYSLNTLIFWSEGISVSSVANIQVESSKLPAAAVSEAFVL